MTAKKPADAPAARKSTSDEVDLAEVNRAAAEAGAAATTADALKKTSTDDDAA